MCVFINNLHVFILRSTAFTSGHIYTMLLSRSVCRTITNSRDASSFLRDQTRCYVFSVLAFCHEGRASSTPLYLLPQPPRRSDGPRLLTNASLVTDNSNTQTGNGQRVSNTKVWKRRYIYGVIVEKPCPACHQLQYVSQSEGPFSCFDIYVVQFSDIRVPISK